MWLILAFGSAMLLGFYDVFKKQALNGNAVVPVLTLNTLLGALIFVPFILSSSLGWGWFEGTVFHVAAGGWREHGLVVLKSFIVIGSWLFGYFGLKHLPITIVGPINATRPVLVLLGAMLIFGERLNLCQWTGMILAMIALVMLSRSGRKEGIDFVRNKWIFCVAMAAVFGVVSALYDRYIMRRLDPMFVQAWCNLYLSAIMLAVLMIMWYPRRSKSTPFQWRWTIVGVSVFLTVADFLYFFSLSQPDAMISVVSMIRRSNVLVSFVCGALWLHEKNVRSKALGLFIILVGMIFLYFGSK